MRAFGGGVRRRSGGSDVERSPPYVGCAFAARHRLTTHVLPVALSRWIGIDDRVRLTATVIISKSCATAAALLRQLLQIYEVWHVRCHEGAFRVVFLLIVIVIKFQIKFLEMSWEMSWEMWLLRIVRMLRAHGCVLAKCSYYAPREAPPRSGG